MLKRRASIVEAGPSGVDKRPCRFTREPQQTRLLPRINTIRENTNAVISDSHLLRSILSFLPNRDIRVFRRVCRRWRDLIDTSPGIQLKLEGAPLKITELLEQILLFLPPKKIFAVQRVSRYWKAVIARSLRCQRLMFLHSPGNAQEIWELVDTHGERVPLKKPDGRRQRSERFALDADLIPTSKISAFADNGQVGSIRRVDQESLDQRQRPNVAHADLVMPLTLNPVMERYPTGRRPLVMVDEEDVTHLGWLDCGETVCYKGPTTPLYAFFSMPISDPPCFRASYRAKLVYENPDSPTSLPIAAWTWTIHDQLMPGQRSLTIGRITQRVFHTRDTRWYLWRNRDMLGQLPIGGSSINTINLPRNIQRLMGWKRIVRRPIVELYVDLRQTVRGFTPIVPTAVERAAISRGQAA